MEPFVGEIRIFPYGFAPKNWALCQGQLLQVNTNQALFSLLGTRYGGDGITTFALPNLQGRTAIHSGAGAGPGLQSYSLGQSGGQSSVTLTVAELPPHTHILASQGVAALGDSDDPTAGRLAQSTIQSNAYASSSNQSSNTMVSTAGGNQPHSNMPPYLVMGYYIAINGIYPSRN